MQLQASVEPIARVRVSLFGAFRVRVGEWEVAPDAWRLRKAAALVKVLALQPQHRLHREVLMDLLWPDLDPAAARNNLKYALHVARRRLEPQASSPTCLVAEDEQIVLGAEGHVTTDLDEFRAAAKAAIASDDPQRCERALDLVTGELLPDDAYEDWAATARADVRELHLDLLRRLARLRESRGPIADAIETWQRVVGTDPLDEHARAALMRLHALRGDRARALREYEALEHVMHDELGLEPSASIRRLRDDVVAGRIGPGPSPGARRALPAALTSFVGRDAELTSLRATLSAARLLTLTGPGGVGKSRLALVLAERAAERVAHGCAWVDLSALMDAAALRHAVAAAVGVPRGPGSDDLAAHIGERELLLVFDDCDRLVSDVAAIARELLRRCPRLRILATSRRTLEVAGERVHEVGPLGIAPPDADIAATAASDAVRLFLDRAGALRGGLDPTSERVRIVATICRRLDGLPLAIELAAARTRALSLDRIVELVTTAARGADPTVQRTIGWSYEQLDAASRALFERLSVFRGRWTLEAAEAVASDDPLARRSVADILQRLVDRSLVRVEVLLDGSLRYAMLDTVRSFAASRLRGPERGRTSERHARYYLARAEDAAAGHDPLRDRARLDDLAADHDEHRAALDRFVERPDAERALRMVAALAPFWSVQGHATEGRRRADEVLALDGGQAPTARRGDALLAAGSLAANANMPAQARARFAEARAIFEGLADRARLARVIDELGAVCVVEGRLDEGRGLHEEALAIRRAIGDTRGMVRSLVGLGNLARYEHAWDAARSLYLEALETAQPTEDPHDVFAVTMHLGTIDHIRDDAPAARGRYEDALRLAREAGDKVWAARISSNLALLRLEAGAVDEARALLRGALPVLRGGHGHGLLLVLEDVAALCATTGDPDLACRIAGCVAAARQAIGDVRPPVRQIALDRWLPRAREVLGDRVDELWRDGERIGLAWAIDVAEQLLSPAEA